MSKIPNASEILLTFLRDQAGKESIATIYYQLFSCMTKDHLDKDMQWIKSLHDGTDDYFKEISRTVTVERTKGSSTVSKSKGLKE